MGVYITNFCKLSFVSAALCLVAGQVFAAQAPNPRSGVVVNTETTVSSVSPQRASGRDVVQVNNVATNATSARTATTERSSATVSRSATSRPSVTVSRSATVPTFQNVVSSSRSATVARQGVVTSNSGATASRAATSRAASSNVVRSATSHSATSTARAASNLSVVGASRSSMARATAVFDDISKIGGGYATCREAYATCMDQLCANANDTYRRCFCSSKFTEFRDIEEGLDQALQLLAQFEDNNLNAVDKTAEEVNAMYSATEGEMAIKNDTSGAAAMLSEIGDILSGKKKNETTITGLIDVDFTSDLDDIWGNSGSSIFGGGSGVDLASLEGQELYTEAQKQCLQLITDSCENDAVLSMAKSAYSILITQDCNAYEKKINAQKESVEQTVRTAEKYLREARLEEYRSHNSADVNECIEKVKTAITADVACGPNYNKCLDYTGAYVNQSTGEPIYSPRLFELQNLITLDGAGGNGDVLGQNADFNSFLDSRRMFAETALDTCRDNAEIVWEEFKRQALIEIAQAQDEKIEEVKMSCVNTMAECYDTQTGALQSFDNTTSQYSGALSATAARDMCADKVIACASLYGDTQGCEFDGNGKLTKGNTSTGAGDSCGLTALLAFVDTVDNVRIAEGCSTAIESYVTNLCTPSTGDEGYPWLCRTKDLGDFNSVNPDAGLDATLAQNIAKFAIDNCVVGGTAWESVPEESQIEAEMILEGIKEQMVPILMNKCSEVDGMWVTNSSEDATKVTAFYGNVYGGDMDKGEEFGKCIENTVRTRCLDYNSSTGENAASYDQTKDECVFTDDWYKSKCEFLGGYYENSVCYTKP